MADEISFKHYRENTPLDISVNVGDVQENNYQSTFAQENLRCAYSKFLVESYCVPT